MQSVIRLDASGLQVDFRTDQADTRHAVARRLDQLPDQLAEAGLPNSRLTAGVTHRPAANHLLAGADNTGHRSTPASVAGSLIDVTS